MSNLSLMEVGQVLSGLLRMYLPGPCLAKVGQVRAKGGASGFSECGGVLEMKSYEIVVILWLLYWVISSHTQSFWSRIAHR